MKVATVGARIAFARRRLAGREGKMIGRAELAKRCKLKGGAKRLEALEDNKATPTPDEVERLAKECGVDRSWLFFGGEEEVDPIITMVEEWIPIQNPHLRQELSERLRAARRESPEFDEFQEKMTALYLRYVLTREREGGDALKKLNLPPNNPVDKGEQNEKL